MGKRIFHKERFDFADEKGDLSQGDIPDLAKADDKEDLFEGGMGDLANTEKNMLQGVATYLASDKEDVSQGGMVDCGLSQEVVDDLANGKGDLSEGVMADLAEDEGDVSQGVMTDAAQVRGSVVNENREAPNGSRKTFRSHAMLHSFLWRVAKLVETSHI